MTTTITLHTNVKVLATTYSAIALTLAMEEATNSEIPRLDWNNVDSIKAVIDERIAALAGELPEAVNEVEADHYELFRVATSEEMRRPLTMGTVHEMMDEYYNRIETNPEVIEIMSRGHVTDIGKAQFEATKAVVENV